MTPKTIPLIASMVQGDFPEVKIGNGVANAVVYPTTFVEFIIIDRPMSSSEGHWGTNLCSDNGSLDLFINSGEKRARKMNQSKCNMRLSLRGEACHEGHPFAHSYDL
jgi:hypothetical protein